MLFHLSNVHMAFVILCSIDFSVIGLLIILVEFCKLYFIHIFFISINQR